MKQIWKRRREISSGSSGTICGSDRLLIAFLSCLVVDVSNSHTRVLVAINQRAFHVIAVEIWSVVVENPARQLVRAVGLCVAVGRVAVGRRVVSVLICVGAVA